MTVSTILAAKGRDVVTIEPSASLAAAAELLAKKRIGAIVILGAACQLDASGYLLFPHTLAPISPS